VKQTRHLLELSLYKKGSGQGMLSTGRH